MTSLAGRHRDETCTIVGCGVSILGLTADAFIAGPVIVLNHAILVIRPLKLSNPVYSMQKDGCIVHDETRPMGLQCICPSPEMVQPELPEILLLSTADSSLCFPTYPLRYVIDVEADLKLAWCTSSAPVAATLALLMGCTGLRMVGFDAYTNGITDRIPGSEASYRTRTGYHQSGRMVAELAEEAEIPIEWVG